MADTTVFTQGPTAGSVPVRKALLAVICFHFAILLAMGLFRHWGNMTSLNDLGVFDQAIWKTLHGQWTIDNNNFPGRQVIWLGYHFNAVLLIFVPLYAIWPSAEWLVVAQALALSVTAWPIFLISSRVHGSEFTAFLWAIIFLFNPFVLSAAAWDFHPVSIAVPAIAWALLAVEKKDLRLLMLCCLFLLTVQVQFGITVATLGGLWGLKHRCWRSSLLLIVLGLLHTVLVLGVVVPMLSPSGTHLMIVDQTGHNSRYGWMGGSLFEIVRTIALHPFRVFGTILMLGGAAYFGLLALPLLGLFVFAPIWTLPAIADFAANTLSSNAMPRAAIAYHSVTLIPVLTTAAVYGSRRIAPFIARGISIPVTHIVLMATLVLTYALAPVPLPGALNYWKPVHWGQPPNPVIKKVRDVVGQRSVCVQTNIGAHFSQREHLYGFPYKATESDAIVLWLDSPTYRNTPGERMGIGTLAHHLQLAPSEFIASVERLLDTPGYGVAFWEEPWLVISRGRSCGDVQKRVRHRLEILRAEWKVQKKGKE